jgi:hypothetical protein
MFRDEQYSSPFETEENEIKTDNFISIDINLISYNENYFFNLFDDNSKHYENISIEFKSGIAVKVDIFYNIQKDNKKEVVNDVELDNPNQENPKSKGALTPKGYYIFLNHRQDEKKWSIVYLVFKNKDDYSLFLEDIDYNEIKWDTYLEYYKKYAPEKFEQAKKRSEFYLNESK